MPTTSLHPLRFALHVHSPDSRDYDRAGSEDPVGDLLDALEAKFDLVAITDHMKWSGAFDLQQRAIDEGRSTKFLVGTELNIRPSNVTTRFHLLIVLPETAGPEKFEQILGSLSGYTEVPPEAARTGSETIECSYEEIKQLRDVIDRSGALLILAHVDSDAGFRRELRDTANEIAARIDNTETDQQAVAELLARELTDLRPHAIEVQRESLSIHYSPLVTELGSFDVPVLVRTDFHSVTQVAEAVPMSVLAPEATLLALRDALRYLSDRRVRGLGPSHFISKIELSERSSSPVFKHGAEIEFSERLTCIVGERGSGKTTLIEVIAESLRSAGVSVFDVSSTDTHLPGLRMACVLDRQGKLAVTVGESQFNWIISFASPSVGVLENHDTTPPRLRATIFRWNDLERLGGSQENFNLLIDEAAGEASSLRSSLRARRDALQGIRAEVSAQLGLVGQRHAELKLSLGERSLHEILATHASLGTEEAQSLTSQMTSLDTENNRISSEIESARQLVERLDSLASDTTAFLRELPHPLANLASEITGPFSRVKKLVELAEATLKSNRATNRRAHSAAQLQLRSMMDGTGDDALTYATIDGDVARLRAQERDYLAQLSQASRRVSDFVRMATDCQCTVDEIHSARMAKVEEIRTDLTATVENCSIEVGKYLKASDIAALLRASGFVNNTRFGQFNRNGFLDEATTLIANDPNEALIGFLTHDSSSWSDGLSTKLNESPICEPDSKTRLPVFDIEQIDAILKLWIDVLSPGDSSFAVDDIAVWDKSPGQRASMMLPLALLLSDGPIFIDQPEDNLDNRALGTFLVPLLSRAKWRRQVVLVTHSPNVVVGADADLVNVIDLDGNSGSVIGARGAIDDNAVRRHIISVMEGGLQAYIDRGRKYGISDRDLKTPSDTWRRVRDQ